MKFSKVLYRFLCYTVADILIFKTVVNERMILDYLKSSFECKSAEILKQNVSKSEDSCT